MNFEFKCPQCGQMVEAEESYRGQVAECPFCGKGIVIPRQNLRTGTLRSDSSKGTSLSINHNHKQSNTGFCSKCGNKLNDEENFCSKCGTPRGTAKVPSSTPSSKESEAKGNVFLSILKKKGTISGICTAIFIGVIVFFCIPDSRERLEKQASMMVTNMLAEHAEFSSFFTVEKTTDCFLVNTDKNSYSGSVDVYCRWKDDTKKEQMKKKMLDLFLSMECRENGSCNVGLLKGVESQLETQLGEMPRFKFSIKMVTDGSRCHVECQGDGKQENPTYEFILTMLELRTDE